MTTVTTASLAADRLDSLLTAVAQELESFRAATAAPKAEAAANRSLLSLESLIRQGRETVVRFDSTADQIIVNIKAAADGSAVQMQSATGGPGPIKNEDEAGKQIMALAASLKDTLLARARAAFQLAALEQRYAMEAPPAPASEIEAA
jgi:hypothetical protein